ncbi:efflux RND transporter periplasmic adaptor subunit [Acidovorax sp. SRB_24]|uniref:efflux RND transporter periplasmic adaptor subunit n=1 Tax=Acidovorax sp. SRB_24 TaxID=1962700 RepID=UPI00145DD662|nr:efflux RND transporter periplasmic adaptor subunit [Acidovorax sp. SRB_24]NMM77459.1 efflux transporter periplasmic adaptor subunit [Acidovorax sp. SRB_24]
MTASPVRRRYVLLGLVCLVAVLASAWYFSRPAPAVRSTAAPPVRVTTAPVLSQAVPIYQTGLGTVTAAQSVTVKTRIDGQLDQVGFTEGQDVKAGQMLARIDPRTLLAQLAQAQAQRARDQAQLMNARSDLQRFVRLIGEDAATQQQLDTQKALVAQLQASVQTDDAQVQYAQVQLSFTTILAPINGRVGARLVDPGNIVHATDANGLVVINQIDPIAVVFTLPEDAFQDINRALQASHEPLAVQAYPRESQELLGSGTLVLLNNQIDPATGTVQLKARFPNPQHRLWPGQFVNVRLLLGMRDQALTVPAAAVQRSQDGTYAYVVSTDGRTVQNQAITVAQIQDGLAVITQGLSAGQRVVVAGQYKLKPGSAIAEATPPAAAMPSGAGARK